MVIDVVIRDQSSKKTIYEGPVEVEVVNSFQPANLYLKAVHEDFYTLRIHQVMSVMFSLKKNETNFVFHADAYTVLDNDEGSLKLVINKPICFVSGMYDANYVAENLYPIETFERFIIVEISK